MTGYTGERKRTQKTEAIKPKVSFKEGFKLWLNQWRWTNIKAIWKQDYKRVYHQSIQNLNTINQKLGR